MKWFAIAMITLEMQELNAQYLHVTENPWYVSFSIKMAALGMYSLLLFVPFFISCMGVLKNFCISL